ncbi:MAG: PQQ-binding-like beta-propeller repeat protein [Candidatus Bathyarchaeota archaeon]|nr:PQQ-binding-like beta-propeller repeat protein [Candidatus Bathyarchaeota archaeon]
MLILLLSFSMFAVGVPVASAHDPPWEIPTWTYIAAYPDPIGIGQDIFIVFWRDYLPRTAEGAYGDRFTFTVEVTKPDGDKETIGPFTSDPVGGAYAVYTPDQIGTYSFVAKVPGHTYTGEPINPMTGTPYSAVYVGDILLPSESLPDTVTVQEEQLQVTPSEGPPTGYWTRPVDASLTEWSQITGNWLNDGRKNLNTKGPETAHIVWTKPQDFGGLTGGEHGAIGYYEGSSYERKWVPVSIMQGRLYYRVGRSDQPQTRGTMCVDLRTGEELLFMNRTSITQGAIYDYESPNQHGTIPYLLASGTITTFEIGPNVPAYSFYDPFTGEWLFTVTERPTGVSAVGPSGEPLIYVVNVEDNWMALWNTTKPFELLGGTSGTGQWQWRPVGKTVNSSDAYEWNVTIPYGLEGNLIGVFEDRVIGGSGFQRFGARALQGEYTVWALSTEPGNEGKLLFNKKLTTPPIGPSENMTLQFEGDLGSVEDGVFVLKVKETMQWYGFDIDTGEKVWGPTERADDFMMYDRTSTIYDHKLYFDGYAGVYCYDIKTGEHLWTWRTGKNGLEGPYEYWPSSGVYFADGKMYVTTGEHSHTQPLYKGWSMYCVDANSGQQLWEITGVWNTIAFADGYMVTLNGMDNRVYCFGKGETATTVSAAPKVSVLGDSVLIEGTVIDESPGANGVAAVADESMTAWMEYVYKQHTMPLDAKGVEVTLDTVDPNGNFVPIGRTTTDITGFYSYLWTPEIPGKYTVIATFEGSGSYFASSAETAVGMTEAQAAPAVTSSPVQAEQPPGSAAPTTTYIAVGVAVVIIVVAAALLLRRRK